VETLVGSAANYGMPLAKPMGVSVDAAGGVWIADTGTNNIEQWSPDAGVTLVAGVGESGQLDGPAAKASFNSPCNVAVDALGTAYVADTLNDTVRVIAGGQVSTLAGTAGDAGVELGPLPGRLDDVYGIALVPGGIVVSQPLEHVLLIIH
jgi:DNA-binding beta-propeller fold protein YncE